MYEEGVTRCTGCGRWLQIHDLRCFCKDYSKIDAPKTNEGSVRDDINQQRKGTPMTALSRGEIG